MTGFEGVVTARYQAITGCDQYVLTPPVKDGKLEEGKYFDETRIEVTDPTPVMIDVRKTIAGPVPG